jgi:hypothetical protein
MGPASQPPGDGNEASSSLTVLANWERMLWSLQVVMIGGLILFREQLYSGDARGMPVIAGVLLLV